MRWTEKAFSFGFQHIVLVRQYGLMIAWHGRLAREFMGETPMRLSFSREISSTGLFSTVSSIGCQAIMRLTNIGGGNNGNPRPIKQRQILALPMSDLVWISNLGIDFRMPIAYLTIRVHQLQHWLFRHPPLERQSVSSVGWVYNF